jgi:hypothetical protein
MALPIVALPGLDLESDPLGRLEGVDLVRAEVGALVTEEDRARKLARLLLPLLDIEAERPKVAFDHAEDLVRLHPLRVIYGRVDLRAVRSEHRHDLLDPGWRGGVTREVTPAGYVAMRRSYCR